MAIFREAASGNRQSPDRQLYTVRNGRILTTIDICTSEQTDGGRESFIDSNTAKFRGTEVRSRGAGDSLIGTIGDYDPLPRTPMAISPSVNPIVEIIPTGPLDGSPSPEAKRAEVEAASEFEFLVDRNSVKSSAILNFALNNFPFGPPGYTIRAYRIDFQGQIGNGAHGARVFTTVNEGSPASPILVPKTVGMLVATVPLQGVNGGVTTCFIFPADSNA